MQLSKAWTVSAAVLVWSTSALALTPGSGRWVQEQTDFGATGLQNAYLYVPANPKPQLNGGLKTGKRALMLTLHGCYQTAPEHVIDQKFNWEATAEQYGMVVVAPTVPAGKTATRPLVNCWDWFGDKHGRSGRDSELLIQLIDSIKARKNLDIDPKQIYVSGFSSGAGVAHVLACSYPDYFAGVVLSAAPTLGIYPITMFRPPSKTPEEVADTCKSYSGNQFNQSFNTQVFANIYGEQDKVVLTAHNVRNREGMQVLYGASVDAGTETLAGGGSAEMWKDGKGKVRIINVVIGDVKHAWSAGAGGSGGGSFVDYEHMNAPAFMTGWLFAHNLRVPR